MTRTSLTVVLAASALSLGLLTVAVGQDADRELTLEERLLELERRVVTLDTQLQLRTTAGAGPEDRVNRDFNLNARLNEIEQLVQQLGYQMTNLERQASEAVRLANQAERSAQMAQQLARDASNRIR